MRGHIIGNLGLAFVILATMYPIALAGSQFLTRRVGLNKKQDKFFKFSKPTKKELLYSLVGTLMFGIYLIYFMLKEGFFK